MANTSPRHIPVLGNVHPVKVEKIGYFFVTSFLCSLEFLAPPAERQRSFSNADSSVVRRRRRPSSSSSSSSSVINFSIKSLISQKLSDNFFSFLACSFLRMVPMHSKNMDLVESS